MISTAHITKPVNGVIKLNLLKRQRKEIEIPLSQTKIFLRNAQLKEVFCDKRMLVFKIVSAVSYVKNACGMSSENEIVAKKQKPEAKHILNKFLAPS